MADPEPNCADCDQQKSTVAVPNESLTNPATFTAPTALASPRVVIEFCNRVRALDSFSCHIGRDSVVQCRWLHRSQWVATELLLTFPPPELASISVIPLTSDETAGRFRVWVFADAGPALVWDRKVEGGFPELKVLKQRIRDKIQPEKSLGHSDAGTHR